ncbi:nephrocystin-3 isoform X2 [Nematostella vectensis]|uniref:nephrocystin-3 isoform X2 n=1 Tax=Nematostella vectensis TaxID=45351 RepID=UPI002077271D|nr:nephrocystin-3 isoform X2 [Nematostella vectensis]
MGTASSIAGAQGSDDIQDDELGDELGEIKKIPVEYPQRRTLTSSLRSVGSIGKKKNGAAKGKIVSKSDSLRSALSFDFDSETEKIRREYEVFRVSKQTEIAELQVLNEKLQSENRRLRGESKVLQATCQKLRYEREMALDAGDQALQRAATFEKERDKVQRQFKIFREAKEQEIQDLLTAKRAVESKLQHVLTAQGYEEGHGAASEVLGGRNNVTDWWPSSLESEPSVDGLAQLGVTYGTDYGLALMDREGPFTNISRDDWNAAMPSILTLSNSYQPPVQSPVLRIYVSAPSTMMEEVNMLKKSHLSKLEALCEDHGKFAVFIHIDEDGETLNEKEFQKSLQMRLDQIKQCTVFLAFLGGKSNRFTYEEFNQGHLECPGQQCAIFCFRNPDKHSDPDVRDENIHLAEEIKTLIRKSSNLKLFDNYDSAEEGAQLAYVELSRYLKKVLSLDKSDGGADDLWSDACTLDKMDELEQLDMFHKSSSSSCEAGLTKYYSELNMHVLTAGHLPPLLVIGDDGSGKSLLLSKWISLQQGSLPGWLLLSHFVGPTSSSSASPVLMLKRLTIQLMRHVTSSLNLTCDPVHLEEEFPRWLEKVSSKLQGGITIVIDSADRLDGAMSHMQWLMDPLPVGVRVILSVSQDTCPAAWRSWPSVNIGPLEESDRDGLLSALFDPTMKDKVIHLLAENSSSAVCNPRFLCTLASEVTCLTGMENLTIYLEQCTRSETTVSLYLGILKQIQSTLDATHQQFLQQILLHVAASRNGLTEPEIRHLIPMSWCSWLDLYSTLQSRGIVSCQVGLITIANRQVYKAISLIDNFTDHPSTSAMVQQVIDYFEYKMRSCCVTFRLVDELPWLLKKTSNKERLQGCLLDMNVFARFFERGRSCELVDYWKYIGLDQSRLGKLYLDVIKSMENEDQPSVLIANLYVAVGQFLKYLGLLSQAAPSLQKALEIRESVLDPDHPLVAQSLHYLAELYSHWGNFSAAEAFFKQAIEITQNALGADHFSLIKDLEGLSILYKKNEKYSLAESCHKRAIAIRQKSGVLIGVQAMKRKIIQVEELSLGPGSQELSRSLNEIGVLYYLQNNHEASKSFFQRSLAMREEILGEDHPEVAQSLHNLAALYNDNKQYDKAEPLYKRALDIRLKAFSPEHSCVASTVKHLATLYRKQGKFDKAEPLYRQALEAREKIFGDNHPGVGTALHNLAVVLCLQNKQEDAIPLYERALRIYEESLGPQHPRVAEVLVNLAKVYYDQGALGEAVRLYKEASDIQQNGPRSPQSRPGRAQSIGMLSNNGTVRNPSHTSHALDTVSMG